MALRRLAPLFLIIFFVAVFIYLACQTYFADSEIWALAIAKQLGSWHTDNISVYHKPLFYLLFRPLYWFISDNVTLYYAARASMCVVAFITFYCSCRLVEHMTTHKKNVLFWLSLFLLTNTYFITQAFRLRADLFAICLHLFFLTWLLRTSDSTSKFWLKSLVFSVATMLITPKAIFLVVLQWLAIFQIQKNNRRLLLSVLLTLGVLCLLLVFSVAHLGAIDFFLHTLLGDQATPAVWDNLSFKFVIIFVRENWLFCFTWLVSLQIYTMLWFKNKLTTAQQILIAQLFGALIILFLNNYRLPFFICSYLPLLAISASGITAEFAMRVKSKSQVAYAVLNGSIASFLFWGAFNCVQNLIDHNNNTQQLNFIRSFENYVRLVPWADYYDVLGSLPLDSHRLVYFGPSQTQENTLAFNSLMRWNPEILVLADRIDSLNDEQKRVLFNNRIKISDSLYVRTSLLTADTKQQLRLEQIEEQIKKDFPNMPLDQGIYVYSQNGPQASALLVLNKDGTTRPLSNPFTLSVLKYLNVSAILLPKQVKTIAVSPLPPAPLMTNLRHWEIFQFEAKY